jgi:hypothetical protein
MALAAGARMEVKGGPLAVQAPIKCATQACSLIFCYRGTYARVEAGPHTAPRTRMACSVSDAWTRRWPTKDPSSDGLPSPGPTYTTTSAGRREGELCWLARHTGPSGLRRRGGSGLAPRSGMPATLYTRVCRWAGGSALRRHTGPRCMLAATWCKCGGMRTG